MTPFSLFNYDSLEQGTQVVVQQRTFEIKELVKRTAQGVILIGQKLIEVKGLLGHGNFGVWLRAEFDWSESAALKMMQVAKQFKSVNFTDLNAAPSALYLLAAPSTPEPAKDEALEHAKEGGEITFALAKEIVDKHKACHAREILHRSESNEWYTPKQYVDGVRQVLGEIDFDPASSEIANQTVMARQIFTLKEDGLMQKWHGRVFLSPPYGFRGNESNQKLWSKKLIEEWSRGKVSEAILLANAMTASKWFQPLWDYTLCFTNHQIRFYRPDGSIGNQPTHASVFVYLGQNRERFTDVFSLFGSIVEKRRTISLL